MKEQLLGGRRVAASVLEEHAGRLSQPLVAARVDGQRTERFVDPGACRVEIGAQHGDRCDVDEGCDECPLVTGGERHAARAHRLTMAAAEPLDPPCGLADSEGNGWFALRRGVELLGLGQARLRGDPRPGTALVGRDHERRGGAAEVPAERADEPADAFERVGRSRLVDPGDDADVVLVEAVAEGVLRGTDVDRPAPQQLAHPHRQHCAAIAQPAISCLGVRGEHLLDDAVDVVGHGLDHLQGGQPFEVIARRLA